METEPGHLACGSLTCNPWKFFLGGGDRPTWVWETVKYGVKQTWLWCLLCWSLLNCLQNVVAQGNFTLAWVVHCNRKTCAMSVMGQKKGVALCGSMLKPMEKCCHSAYFKSEENHVRTRKAKIHTGAVANCLLTQRTCFINANES